MSLLRFHFRRQHLSVERSYLSHTRRPELPRGTSRQHRPGIPIRSGCHSYCCPLPLLKLPVFIYKKINYWISLCSVFFLLNKKLKKQCMCINGIVAAQIKINRVKQMKRDAIVQQKEEWFSYSRDKRLGAHCSSSSAGALPRADSRCCWRGVLFHQGVSSHLPHRWTTQSPPPSFCEKRRAGDTHTQFTSSPAPTLTTLLPMVRRYKRAHTHTHTEYIESRNSIP